MQPHAGLLRRRESSKTHRVRSCHVVAHLLPSPAHVERPGVAGRRALARLRARGDGATETSQEGARVAGPAQIPIGGAEGGVEGAVGAHGEGDEAQRAKLPVLRVL